MKQLFILKGKLCIRKISLGSGDGFGTAEEHLLSRDRRSVRHLLNSNDGC